MPRVSNDNPTATLEQIPVGGNTCTYIHHYKRQAVTDSHVSAHMHRASQEARFQAAGEQLHICTQMVCNCWTEHIRMEYAFHG